MGGIAVLIGLTGLAVVGIAVLGFKKPGSWLVTLRLNDRRRLWGALAAGIALFILGVMLTPSESATEPQSDEAVAAEDDASDAPAATAVPSETAAPTETPDPTNTPEPRWEDGIPVTEDAVRVALEDADGISRSIGLDNIKALTVTPDTGFVEVTYQAGDVLGETDLLTVAARTTYSAMRALFANPHVQRVRVTVLAEWTDQYGKTEVKDSTRATMSREVVDAQVDWGGLEDRVLADNKLMFCITEEVYIHPAIYVRLKDKGCLGF